MLDERRLRAVKIDVEGREVEVLESLHSTLTESRPALFVECNPEALARAGASAARLLEAIAVLGFDASVINEDARCLEPVREPRAPDRAGRPPPRDPAGPTAERKTERSLLAARSMLNSERTRSRPAAP